MNSVGEDMRGKFIVFEGPDGSGKTTQLSRVASALESAGRRIKCECEPTGGEIGRQIRRALGGETGCTPEALALLFAADRCEHVRALEAMLDGGDTVLCDRYVFSSIAYQGLELDVDWVAEINRRATERLLPDAVVYIDLPTESCMARIASGRTHTEIFETTERIAKVRENYERAFAMFPTLKLIRIDGAQSIEDVTRDIVAKLSDI